jgi:hypothetical protein
MHRVGCRNADLDSLGGIFHYRLGGMQIVAGGNDREEHADHDREGD